MINCCVLSPGTSISSGSPQPREACSSCYTRTAQEGSAPSPPRAVARAGRPLTGGIWGRWSTGSRGAQTTGRPLFRLLLLIDSDLQMGSGQRLSHRPEAVMTSGWDGGASPVVDGFHSLKTGSAVDAGVTQGRARPAEGPFSLPRQLCSPLSAEPRTSCGPCPPAAWGMDVVTSDCGLGPHVPSNCVNT